MSLNAAQLTALKAELQSDPRGYGFAALITAGSDQACADAMNLSRDGSAGRVPTTPTASGGVASGIITVKRSDISPDEFIEAVDVRDFITTANNLQAAYLSALLARPKIRLINDAGTDTRTWTNIKIALNNTQGSQTRLAAVAVRVGSRAEELFSAGAVVASSDVSIALRGS